MSKEFDAYLMNSLDRYGNSKIKDAMAYCLEGGKHFRPEVLFAIVKGFKIPEEKAYPVACAIEYIHSYSLIHDDLPCMDNDDFRRGKLSCHRRFGEDIALLTGDALLTHSFSCITDSDLDASLKVHLLSALAKYSGLDGMIYGQLLDVTATEEIDEKTLFEIQDNKTSGLFKLTCLCAMYLGKEDDYRFFETLGSKLGVVFQNQDDLFDAIRSEEDTGKSNSDKRNKKITALSFKSVDELEKHIDDLFKDLHNFLKRAPFDASYLNALIDKMASR